MTEVFLIWSLLSIYISNAALLYFVFIIDEKALWKEKEAIFSLMFKSEPIYRYNENLSKLFCTLLLCLHFLRTFS